MEHKRENPKGQMREVAIHVILVIVVSILIHFIFNGEHTEALPKFSFSKSLALATVLRLSVFHVKHR